MRFVRHRLIFLGLVALDEAAAACHDEPIEPSIPLRVVVTMLHALARSDRAIFDEFLAALRMTPREGEIMADTLRAQRAGTALKGIARKLGHEMSVRLSSDIFDSRHPVNPGDEQWSKIHHPCRGEVEVERQRFARAFYEAGQKKDGR